MYIMTYESSDNSEPHANLSGFESVEEAVYSPANYNPVLWRGSIKQSFLFLFFHVRKGDLSRYYFQGQTILLTV